MIPVITPSKAKTYVAFVGTVLTIVIPLVVQMSTNWPPQYQALLSGIIGLLTIFGVYQAPYKPKGTVIVPLDALPIGEEPPSIEQEQYKNPWK